MNRMDEKNLQNIPTELRNLDQWVGVGIDSKVPMRIDTLYAASSTNPQTWRPFAEAEEAVKQGEITYPGFVFNDNGIVGIDIDDGYGKDGFLSTLACDIIGECKSYTERSKSGRGFHILLRGTLPFKGKNNLKGVEIYKSARYFIMTGDVLLYRDVIENQDAIDYIIERYFPDIRDLESEKPVTTRIYHPIWERPQDRIKLRPVYPRIPDGCRNICLTSLAGMLHNQGYSPQQIFDELIYCNTVACDPLLPESEIETIVGSVTRYKR